VKTLEPEWLLTAISGRSTSSLPAPISACSTATAAKRVVSMTRKLRPEGFAIESGGVGNEANRMVIAAQC